MSPRDITTAVVLVLVLACSKIFICMCTIHRMHDERVHTSATLEIHDFKLCAININTTAVYSTVVVYGVRQTRCTCCTIRVSTSCVPSWRLQDDKDATTQSESLATSIGHGRTQPGSCRHAGHVGVSFLRPTTIPTMYTSKPRKARAKQAACWTVLTWRSASTPRLLSRREAASPILGSVLALTHMQLVLLLYAHVRYALS